MNAAVQVIEAEGWELAVHAGEPVVEDTALATHLELDRRFLRRLVRTHRDAKHITPIARAERTGGRGRPGEGYLLNEPDALFIVTRSNAPKAIAITKQMIRVFIAARRAMSATTEPPSKAAPRAARKLPAQRSLRFRPVVGVGNTPRLRYVPDSAPVIGQEVRLRANPVAPASLVRPAPGWASLLADLDVFAAREATFGARLSIAVLALRAAQRGDVVCRTASTLELSAAMRELSREHSLACDRIAVTAREVPEAVCFVAGDAADITALMGRVLAALADLTANTATEN